MQLHEEQSALERWADKRPSTGGSGSGAQQGALGAAAVRALVGEQHGGAAHAEQAVGDEHGAVVAKVPVLRDVFGGDDQRGAVGVHLGNITRAPVRSPDTAFQVPNPSRICRCTMQALSPQLRQQPTCGLCRRKKTPSFPKQLLAASLMQLSLSACRLCA